MPEAVVEMVGRVSKASSRAKALTWTPELAQNKDQVHRMAYPDDPSFSPSYHSAAPTSWTGTQDGSNNGVLKLNVEYGLRLQRAARDVNVRVRLASLIDDSGCRLELQCHGESKRKSLYG